MSQLAVYGDPLDAEVAIVDHAEPSGERSNLTEETPVPVSEAVAESAFVEPIRSAEGDGAVTAPVGLELSTVTLTDGVGNVCPAPSVMNARTKTCRPAWPYPIGRIGRTAVDGGRDRGPGRISGERSNLTDETPEPVSDAVADKRFVEPCSKADAAGAVSEPVGSELSTVTVTPGVGVPNVFPAASIANARTKNVPVSTPVFQLAV